MIRPFGPEAIEGVGARVDELIRASGHAQAAARAFVGSKGQPGPSHGDAVGPDERPSSLVATQYPFSPVGQRGQLSGPHHQGEQLGEVVLVAGQRHLVQGDAVVGFQLRKAIGHRSNVALENGMIWAPQTFENPP